LLLKHNKEEHSLKKALLFWTSQGLDYVLADHLATPHLVHRFLTLNGIRYPFHRGVPIDLVGVDPVECGRVGEKLEKERREPVPKPHLDRIGHDLPLTRSAPMLNHSL